MTEGHSDSQLLLTSILTFSQHLVHFTKQSANYKTQLITCKSSDLLKMDHSVRMKSPDAAYEQTVNWLSGFHYERVLM